MHRLRKGNRRSSPRWQCAHSPREPRIGRGQRATFLQRHTGSQRPTPRYLRDASTQAEREGQGASSYREVCQPQGTQQRLPSQNGAQGDRELNLYRRTSNEGHLRSVLRSTEASERWQNIWSLDPEWSGLRAVLTRQNCPCYSRAFRQGPGTEALDNDFIIAVLTGNDSYIVFCLAVLIFFSVMHPWALGTRQVFSYGIING